MAKYEDEGYCPATDVQDKLSKHDNQSLYGLWNLFKDSVVYEKEDCLHHPLNPEVCNDVFSYDPISAKVLETIVRTNVNAEKILVHQLYEYDDFLFEIKELVCNSSNSKNAAEVKELQEQIESLEEERANFAEGSAENFVLKIFYEDGDLYRVEEEDWTFYSDTGLQNPIGNDFQIVSPVVKREEVKDGGLTHYVYIVRSENGLVYSEEKPRLRVIE